MVPSKTSSQRADVKPRATLKCRNEKKTRSGT